MARFVVHLVHGTQFYFLRKPRIPWIEDDQGMESLELDSFRHGLRKQLEERGHVVERFDVVPWSGRNRHRARLDAARELRKHVLTSPEESAHHFVIAHSHGGNASLLALKNDDDGTLSDRLSGIACLSTPFLVVLKQAWALGATIAWLVLVLIGGALVINAQFASALVAIPLSMAALLMIALPSFVILRRYKNLDRWTQAPQSSTVPLLIVRCPGDEASTGLGFAAILARIVYHIEHLMEWPIRLLQGQGHPVRFLIGAVGVTVAVAIAVVANESLGSWLGANWKWIAIVMIAPWLLGLPVRVFIYGLAYGIDLFGLPLVLSISAEATPLGRWETYLVAPSNAEERRAAHSEPYSLRSVQSAVAEWISELATRQDNAAVGQQGRGQLED